jgi:hypothetical protein
LVWLGTSWRPGLLIYETMDGITFRHVTVPEISKDYLLGLKRARFPAGGSGLGASVKPSNNRRLVAFSIYCKRKNPMQLIERIAVRNLLASVFAGRLKSRHITATARSGTMT